MYILVTTDSRNRTVAEIRHMMGKHGGNLGANGCVSYMFHKKGIILVDKEGVDEDELMEIALEAGAEDMIGDDEHFEISTDPSTFEDIRSAIEESGFPIASAELTMVPDNTTKVDAKDAPKILRLMDALENQDDVQNVYSNFDIPEEILAALED